MGTLKGFGQRALHLVDIENLTGGPFSSERLESLAAYLSMAGWGPGDLTYVAANHLLIKRLCFEARPMPCQGHPGNRDLPTGLALQNPQRERSLRLAPSDSTQSRRQHPPQACGVIA